MQMKRQQIIVNVGIRPSGGGAEFLTRQIHKYLLDSGLESTLIFLIQDGQKLGLGEHALTHGPRSLKNITTLRRHCKKLLNDYENVTVHAHLTYPIYFLAIACIGLPINLLCTEHSTQNRRRKVPFFYFVERLIYKSFKKIICISDGTRENMIDWLGEKFSDSLQTIHNGARQFTSVERSRIEGRKVRLVSVGSLKKVKNFHTVIQSLVALQHLVDKYWIVGVGIEQEKLEQLIEELDLGHLVELVGWQSCPQKWFNSADIQVIPSLYEGFGLVAIEGMSTGLPVVSSNVCGLCEVLPLGTSSSVLVDKPQDSSEWSRAIRRMIQNLHKEGSEALSKVSRLQAQQFDLQTMCSRYQSIYEQMV